MRLLIVKALFSRHEVFSGTAAVSVTDTTVCEQTKGFDCTMLPQIAGVRMHKGMWSSIVALGRVWYAGSCVMVSIPCALVSEASHSCEMVTVGQGLLFVVGLSKDNDTV